MKKATPYISALIYAVLLTIISFNATATTKLNWNAKNSESGFNSLDVNEIENDVAIVVAPVANRLKQGTRSKIYSFKANLDDWFTHNASTFKLSNNPSAVSPPLLWLTAISLIGGLVSRRVTLPTATRTTRINHEV